MEPNFSDTVGRPAGIIVVSSRDRELPAFRFSGVAFTDDAIIIGEGGFARYLAQRAFNAEDFGEGRFAAFVRDDSGHVALADSTAQETLFYYSAADYWAISNSFLGLAERVRQDGFPCDIYAPALAAFSLPNSMFEQLISNNTPIRQIKMLPLGARIWIGPDRRLKIYKANFPSPPGNREAYTEALSRYIRKWSARLGSLAEFLGEDFTVDISGGRDSRVVLALLGASGAKLSKVNFSSLAYLKEDFVVAESLLGRFGLSVTNRPLLKSSVSPEFAYQLWKYGNLGIYLPLYRPLSYRPSFKFRLHGAGGECLRQHYQTPPSQLLSWARKHLSVDVYPAFEDEFRTVFDELGAGGDPAFALRAHYLNYRARLHFGRNWFRSLSGYLLTPLTSLELVNASRWLSPEDQQQAQMACDLMLATWPELCHHRFDDDAKAITEEMIARSPFHGCKGSVVTQLPSLKLFVEDGGEQSSDSSEGRPATDADMVRLLLADLDRARTFASGFSFFPSDAVARARNALSDGTRLVKAARTAAHFVAAGEYARLCS